MSDDLAGTGSAPVQLNCELLQLGPEGIREYCWPVRLEDDLAFYENLMRDFVGAIRSGLERDAAGALELMVMSNVLLGEIRGLLCALIVVDAAARLGKTVGYQDGCMRYIPALVEDRELGEPPVLGALRRAFPQKSFSHYLLKPFRKIRKALGGKTIPAESASGPVAAQKPVSNRPRAIGARKIRRHHLLHCIVSTKRKGVVSEHARRVDGRVVLAKHGYWFRPISDKQARKAVLNLDRGLEDGVIETVRINYDRKGFSLSSDHEDHFRSFMRLGVNLVRIHMDRLRRCKRRLPRRLWTGTCGNIWDRMLRIVTRENGGHVTGHSHAGGWEHTDYPYLYSAEFIACDEFVVHNPTQVRMVHKHVDPSLLFESMPRIACPQGPSTLDYMELQSPASGNGDKVMFMSSCAYGSDRTYDAAFMSFITELDFLARLFPVLVKDGLRVYFKPHPTESPARPPESLEAMSGAVRLTDDFETVMHAADIIVFLDPRSSTFHASILGGKAVILVHPGFITWEDEAMELLKKRCAVVPAYRDEQNRLQVDLERFREAVREAPGLVGNNEFMEAFFAVGGG